MTTKQKLSEAKTNLEALIEDLPGYQGLLESNKKTEAELQAAHRDRSKETPGFEALAQAKSAVIAATELLEQHEAEIESARAEVAALESQLQSEQEAAKRKQLEAELGRLEDVFFLANTAAYESLVKAAKTMASTSVKHNSLLHELRNLGGTRQALPSSLEPSRASGDQVQLLRQSDRLAEYFQKGQPGWLHAPAGLAARLSTMIGYLIRSGELDNA